MPGVMALIVAGLLPALFSAAFCLLDKKTAFARLPYRLRQTVVGVAFGALAVFSTEFGIDIGGASINVRDAAPLAAGLAFGAPAGIIAGVIGGVERWFAALWGVGEYTRLACSLATVLAGLIGAGARKLLFDEEKPGWLYGLTIGMTTEVLHMLMIFLTNMSDTHRAFTMVRQCAGIMVLANSLSVTLSMLAVSLFRTGKPRFPRGAKKLARRFQRWLLVCVCAAFAVTSLFTWSLQTQIAEANADYLLRVNARDVLEDIGDASDDNLLSLTREIASALPAEITNGALAERRQVSEINYVDANGVIAASTAPEFVGYDMASGEQSAFFLPLLGSAGALVQAYQPIAYDETVSRKYAGVALDGGFLQVGYDAERFRRDIDGQVARAARNRRIGQNGCVIICDASGVIVSDRDGHEGENLNDIGPAFDRTRVPEKTRFEASVHGAPSYCAYTVSEGYTVIAVLPVREAVFSRDLAVYITAFIEVVVYAALFAHVYFLIKRLIVGNIRKINGSLAKIASGNLNVTVNVRASEEFAALSDDINATVATLKAYIAEAAARIDKELAFARAIQQAALPSVFPPYPARRDFDIYANMDAAKEVGGDFYDFYLLDADTLVFLIADVSGKGIPAAMFMMTAKTLVKGLAEQGLDADEIFMKANDKLCENNDAEMFVTAWLGILDLPSGRLRYVNAGHNPPALRRGNGSFAYLQGKSDFVLAGMEGTAYTAREMRLMPGDILYLYTDGVTEATDAADSPFGEKRLLDALNAHTGADAESLCHAAKRAVDGFVEDAPQFDDITMLALRLNYLQSGETIITIPNAMSAELVNDFIDIRAKQLDIPEKTASKLHIIADEIHANIRAYSGAIRTQLDLSREGDELTLRLMDDGTPYNPLSVDAPDVSAPLENRKTGGLGIFMARSLADDMAYEYSGGQNILTIKLKT